MNRILPVHLLLSLSLNACAQKVAEPQVPQSVKSAFAKQFPKAVVTRWELENAKEYEAEFVQDGAKWSANYAQDGKWLETEHGIAEAALPEPVRTAIAKDHASAKVKESEMVESPSGTAYEVELVAGGKTTEVMYSADGNVLKTQAEEDDENEEDED